MGSQKLHNQREWKLHFGHESFCFVLNSFFYIELMLLGSKQFKVIGERSLNSVASDGEMGLVSSRSQSSRIDSFAGVLRCRKQECKVLLSCVPFMLLHFYALCLRDQMRWSHCKCRCFSSLFEHVALSSS